jgi:hypothetical protein
MPYFPGAGTSYAAGSGIAVLYSAQAPTAGSAMASMATVVGSWFNTSQAISIGLDSGGAGTLNAGSFLAVYWFPGTS